MENLSSIFIANAIEHKLIRKALSDYIQALDTRFTVLFDACDGEELLSTLQNSILLPDICIFDIRMSRLNGYDTILKLKRGFPSIRCIILSNISDDFCISTAIRNGATGYLARNAKPLEIKNAISDVFEDKYYFSEDIAKEVPNISKHFFKDRELEFLSWCCSDLSYHDIAQQMHLGKRTIENYCLRLRNRLKIDSRIGLAMFATNIGLSKVKDIDQATLLTRQK